MFSITEEAEIYVADLFEQQDEKDLGLKVDVEKAGLDDVEFVSTVE